MTREWRHSRMAFIWHLRCRQINRGAGRSISQHPLPTEWYPLSSAYSNCSEKCLLCLFSISLPRASVILYGYKTAAPTFTQIVACLVFQRSNSLSLQYSNAAVIINHSGLQKSTYSVTRVMMGIWGRCCIKKLQETVNRKAYRGKQMTGLDNKRTGRDKRGLWGRWSSLEDGD